MTPQRSFEVPDVLEVQEIPSEEVRIVPDEPTAKNLILELAVGFEDVLSDFAVGFEDVLSDFAQDNLKKTKKIRKK